MQYVIIGIALVYLLLCVGYIYSELKKDRERIKALEMDKAIKEKWLLYLIKGAAAHDDKRPEGLHSYEVRSKGHGGGDPDAGSQDILGKASKD